MKGTITSAVKNQPVKKADNPVYTAMNAAIFLGVHYTKLLTWRRKKLVSSMKYENRFFFRESDLLKFQKSRYFEAYLDAQKKKPGN